MKEKMPEVAAFIDSLCDAFGKETIHAQIRKGLNGEPVFYAFENGYEVGTRSTEKRVRISWHPVTGCSMVVE
jgi:hypothetical protein